MLDKRKKGAQQPQQKSAITEETQLIQLIETHNNLMGLISENIITLNENVATVNAMEQGNAYKIFTQLSAVVPEITVKVASEYKQRYNKSINRVKLENFLSVVFKALATVPAAKMVGIINRADLDKNAYTRMLKGMESNDVVDDNPTNEPAPQQGGYDPARPDKFMPEKVGNYDLSRIKPQARMALAQKAAQIISRNNDIEQNSANMLEVMKQLIDDINKNGQKKIPTM
jgi:hypothetical protein